MKTPPPLTWGTLDHRNHTATTGLMPVCRIRWAEHATGFSYHVESLMPTQTELCWQMEFSTLEAAKDRASELWHLWCYHANLCALPPWRALTPGDRRLAAQRLDRADQLDAMQAAGWRSVLSGRWMFADEIISYHEDAAVLRWQANLAAGFGLPQPTTTPPPLQ